MTIVVTATAVATATASTIEPVVRLPGNRSGNALPPQAFGWALDVSKVALHKVPFQKLVIAVDIVIGPVCLKSDCDLLQRGNSLTQGQLPWKQALQLKRSNVFILRGAAS